VLTCSSQAHKIRLFHLRTFNEGLLVDLQQPHETMTLATDKSQRKSLMQLMSRSTIYQRNESRRAKTLALKDDPRPAAVRVLSGLPGFRIFIHPYQPAEATVGISVSTVPTALAFSQENVFMAHHLENDTNPNTSSPLTGIAAVCFAAGVGGAFSELLCGRSAMKPFSPFGGLCSPAHIQAGQISAVFHRDAATMTFLQRHVASPPSMIPSFQVSASQIAARAMATSFLFGTKALVERGLGKSTSDGISLVSVVSSCAAGGALGLSQTLTGTRVVWGREILGATVYFTSYETIKSVFSTPQASENKTYEPSKIAIAIAGAIAGICYETVRIFGVTSPVRSLQPYSVTQAQSLASIALRAAPAHALLFLGYEATLSLLAVDQHR
jgi:hypothetical protein